MSKSVGLSAREVRRAANWLVRDAVDDFYPDVVGYRDLPLFAIANTGLSGAVASYRDGEGSQQISVPKSALLSRGTWWVPPGARLRYLSILSRLAPRLSSAYSSACYSYRPLPGGVEAYPFATGPQGWLRFRSEFREAAQTRPYCIITDLSAYFDHLQPARLVEGLGALADIGVGDGLSDDLADLQDLLDWVVGGRQGIPQNLDPSSFFASVFLSDVDDLLAKRVPGVRLFRYSDDIRLVSSTRGDALRALNELQELMRQKDLFLNSAKTRLLEPGSDEWASEMSGYHDQQLAKVGKALQSGSAAVRRVALSDCEGALVLLRADDNQQIARAYCGQIVRVAGDPLLGNRAKTMVQDVVGWGLRKHPGKSREWCELAMKVMDPMLETDLLAIAGDADHNTHAWMEVWIAKALGSSPHRFGQKLKFFETRAFESDNPFVRTWAVWGLARMRDQKNCRRACEEYLRPDCPSSLVRAAVVAAGALEKGRERYLERGSKVSLVAQSLAAHVGSGRVDRQPRSEPTPRRPFISGGVVEGGFRRFRLNSAAGFDYE